MSYSAGKGMNSKDQDEHQYYSGIPLSENDIAFIQCTFGHDILTCDDLNTILSDETLRDSLLDSRRLFDAVTKDPNELDISEYFFYNVLSRQAALQAGLKDSKFAENVSLSLLEMADLHHADLKSATITASSKLLPVNLSILVRDIPGSKKVFLRAQIGQLKLVFDGQLQNSARVNSPRSPFLDEDQEG